KSAERREAIRPYGLAPAVESGAQPVHILDPRHADTLGRRLLDARPVPRILLVRRERSQGKAEHERTDATGHTHGDLLPRHFLGHLRVWESPHPSSRTESGVSIRGPRALPRPRPNGYIVIIDNAISC